LILDSKDLLVAAQDVVSLQLLGLPLISDLLSMRLTQHNSCYPEVWTQSKQS